MDAFSIRHVDASDFVGGWSCALRFMLLADFALLASGRGLQATDSPVPGPDSLLSSVSGCTASKYDGSVDAGAPPRPTGDPDGPIDQPGDLGDLAAGELGASPRPTETFRVRGDPRPAIEGPRVRASDGGAPA